MKFEDLQQSWQAQPVEAFTGTPKVEEQKTKWQQRQRKLLRSNIFMSLGFLAAMIGIGWVYFAYRAEFGLPFRISIATCYLLMVVFATVNWRSYAFKNESMDVSAQEYIRYQIGKLNWQRKIVQYYTHVYTILLWLALVLYTWEITERGTALFRFTALAIITAYIGGITFWTTKKKQRKTLLEINGLITELKHINQDFNGDDEKL
ncbi:MAG: hypothetical protein EOO88_02060 [Pedobacter sp.]|nr:MAG: hypothetical protein EOO88_02060 [Pedobacter sp.]